MRNIKLTIEYDGTRFNGWQFQKQKNRTVQDEIQKVLKKIFKDNLKLIGSGRTDSGVHAFGQVANFKTANKRLTLSEIQNALNANLPEDIAIVGATEVSSNFHAQYSTKNKTYRYTILNREGRCAQQRQFSLLVPRKLNVHAMRIAAKDLIGKKDFRSFMGADTGQKGSQEDKDTVRTIKRLEITRRGDYIYIEIKATGFLYKMVRNITGTLMDVGSGKLPKDCIPKILKKKNRAYASATAPAKGLCLLEVTY